MDKDKLRILELIIGMWQNNLIEGNGAEYFENWCCDNINNEQQEELMNKVKDYVDKITSILDEE